MANYFFNHANDAPCIDKWFEEHSFIKINDPLDIGYTIHLAAGDLVFVHATDNSFWIDKAQKNLGIDFVFMSRDTGDIRREETWPDNIHICKYPANEIKKFDRAKQFFTEPSLGKRLWDLLIPDSKNHLIALSILCQGYLAAHGDDDSIKELSEELKKEVQDSIKGLPCELKNKVQSKAGETKKKKWWTDVLGADKKNDKQKILNELNAISTNKVKEKETLSNDNGLIDEIYKDGDNLPNGALVANAYSALKQIVGK